MPGMMEHEMWPKLRDYVNIEVYSPDGGHSHPRVRIEFDKLPPILREQALDAFMPCVACEAPVHFVRQRHPAGRGKSGHFYYAPTCPLDVKIGCSRGMAARDEYIRVKAYFRPDLLAGATVRRTSKRRR